MDSFSKRRPPKFTEPVDFNKINNLFEPGNDYSYSNQLLDRFTGLFSSDWNSSIDHGPFNFSADSPMNITPKNNLNNSTNHTIGTNNNGSLYSSNLAHTISGIGSNPFNTKGLNSFDYTNQWIAPRSCPPIGSRNSLAFNSFSVNPANQPNNNNSNINHNANHNANNLNNNLNNINTSTVNNIANNNANPANNFNNSTNNGQVLVNLNETRSPMVIGSNQQAHLHNNNSAFAAANNLNPLSASYVPPRVRRRNPTCTECVFCKNNGHPPSFYKGHILKDPLGRIVCPMLRSYICPICRNKNADMAHTVRYCPWNKPSFWNNSGVRPSMPKNLSRFTS